VAAIDIDATALQGAQLESNPRRRSHVLCISLKTGEHLPCFSPLSTDIKVIALDASGTRVASASTLRQKDEKSIEVHEVLTGKLLFEVGNNTRIRRPEGIVFCGMAKTLPYSEGVKTKRTTLSRFGICKRGKGIPIGVPLISSVIFDKAGDRMLVSSRLGDVVVIDLSSPEHPHHLYSLGSRCLTFNMEAALGTKYLKEISVIRKSQDVPPHCKNELAIPDESYNLDAIQDVKLSDDERTAYTLAQDGSIRIWNLKDRNVISRSKPALRTLDDLRTTKGMFLAPNGKMAFRAVSTGDVQVWNVGGVPFTFTRQNAEAALFLGGANVIVLPSQRMVAKSLPKS